MDLASALTEGRTENSIDTSGAEVVVPKKEERILFLRAMGKEEYP